MVFFIMGGILSIWILIRKFPNDIFIGATHKRLSYTFLIGLEASNYVHIWSWRPKDCFKLNTFTLTKAMRHPADTTCQLISSCYPTSVSSCSAYHLADTACQLISSEQKKLAIITRNRGPFIVKLRFMKNYESKMSPNICL